MGQRLLMSENLLAALYLQLAYESNGTCSFYFYRQPYDWMLHKLRAQNICDRISKVARGFPGRLVFKRLLQASTYHVCLAKFSMCKAKERTFRIFLSTVKPVLIKFSTRSLRDMILIVMMMSGQDGVDGGNWNSESQVLRELSSGYLEDPVQ